MTILPVIIAPDPRLKATCSPVDGVDDEVRRLMDDMLETMYQVPGIGLAAPQVGVHKRIIVVDATRKDEDPAPMQFANPELIWASEELGTYEFPSGRRLRFNGSTVRSAYRFARRVERTSEESLVAVSVSEEVMDMLLADGEVAETTGLPAPDHLSRIQGTYRGSTHMHFAATMNDHITVEVARQIAARHAG